MWNQNTIYRDRGASEHHTSEGSQHKLHGATIFTSALDTAGGGCYEEKANGAWAHADLLCVHHGSVRQIKLHQRILHH